MRTEGPLNELHSRPGGSTLGTVWMRMEYLRVPFTWVDDEEPGETEEVWLLIPTGEDIEIHPSFWRRVWLRLWLISGIDMMDIWRLISNGMAQFRRRRSR